MQSTTSSTGGKTQLWKINDQKAQKNGPCQAVYWVREKRPAEHDAIKKRAKNGYKEEKIWTTGNVYKGEWFNNQKQGYGICIWSNGNKYEGDWAHDDREGHGVHWIKDKTTGKLRRVYAGNWKDDKKHGTGVYFYKDGSRYEGEFIADQRHGKGTQYYVNGDVYVGEWKHDKQGGFGTLTKANGDVYEGDWLNGLREGSGIYFYKEKDKIYDGEWVADVAKCGVYTDAEHFFEPEVKIDDSIGKTGDDSDPYAPRMRRKQRAIPIPRLRLADPEGVLASCIEQIQKQRHTVRTLPYVELSTLFSATALDRLRTIYSRHDQPTSTSTSTSQRQHTSTEHVPVATLNKMLEEMGYERVDATRLAQVILDAGKSATEYLNFTDFVRCVHLYDAGESIPVADER